MPAADLVDISFSIIDAPPPAYIHASHAWANLSVSLLWAVISKFYFSRGQFAIKMEACSVPAPPISLFTEAVYQPGSVSA
jgi:hypothetical protein